VDRPLESVTHGQCDARPTVTSLATESHHPLTGTKLYCLVNRGMCVREQYAQSRYLAVIRAEVDPGTTRSLVWHATVTPPSHTLRLS